MVVMATMRQLWGYLGYKMLEGSQQHENKGSINAEYIPNRFQHSYPQIIAHLRYSILLLSSNHSFLSKHFGSFLTRSYVTGYFQILE